MANTRALVEAFKSVKVAPEGSKLSADDRKANRDAFKRIDALFDFDKLTGAAIAAHRSKLSKEQLAAFKGSFRGLLRVIGYPDSGRFLGKAELAFSAKGSDVAVEIVIEAEDLETEVTFRWSAGRVYDVLFDGDSLAKDYENQFGRILTKKGPDGLVKLLTDKLADETKKRGAID